MTPEAFRRAVARAALAPSVHNTQPARFRLESGRILIGADPSCHLAAGDPEGRDAGLSCGAAVEALVIALAGQGTAAVVADRWPADDRTTLPGLRLAAVVTPGGVARADALDAGLERRFTHRGAFTGKAPGDWQPADAVLVTDVAVRARIAAMQDKAGLAVMRRGADRAELLHWMRLSRRHPRWDRDGMNAVALRMSPVVAWAAGLALGPLWPLLDRLGITPALTAEAATTRSAPVIAAFHRPVGESPVTTGRAYLRLTLEAALRGMAMWPMAALADDPAIRAQLEADLRLPPDRRLVQMIRMGQPDRPAPPRARRGVEELIL